MEHPRSVIQPFPKPIFVLLFTLSTARVLSLEHIRGVCSAASGLAASYPFRDIFLERSISRRARKCWQGQQGPTGPNLESCLSTKDTVPNQVKHVPMSRAAVAPFKGQGV